MTREAWLETHPYLRSIANLSADVERTMAGIDVPAARIPDWNEYRADFLAGVPLLSSDAAAVDLEPGERLAAALGARLDLTKMEPRVFRPGDSPGIPRYVVWVAMRQYLRPVVQAFDAWRDEEKWLRRQCPTCESLPAMAQLVGADPGRKRLLSCGCCGTRWQFARTGCPFCETNAQKLASIAIGGEPQLRIDHCESCHGYLKAYNGEGQEPLFLADWSSLHLDLLAHDRGLKRLAASLYDFEAVPAVI